MKKLIFLFSITLLTLASSCSKKDDATTTPPVDGGTGGGGTGSTKLPKAIVSRSEPDGATSNTDYTYDGTKTATTVSGKTKNVYSYNSSGVLVDIQSSYDGTYNSITKFFFEKNDLKRTETYGVDVSKKETIQSSTYFSYNADGSVTTESSIYDAAGVETKLKTSTVSTYSKGNLSQAIQTTKIDSKNYTVVTSTYEYDTNPNYFKNVTGQPATIRLSNNNPTSVTQETVVTENATNAPKTTTLTTYKYKYNSSNFVTEIKTYGKELTNTSSVYYE
jgi:hypothetical protein